MALQGIIKSLFREACNLIQSLSLHKITQDLDSDICDWFTGRSEREDDDRATPRTLSPWAAMSEVFSAISFLSFSSTWHRSAIVGSQSQAVASWPRTWFSGSMPGQEMMAGKRIPPSKRLNFAPR